MIMLKKLSIFLVLLGLAVWLLSYSTGYVLVIPVSSYEGTNDTTSFQKGDTLNLFNDYDFDKGDWSAYIILGLDDLTDQNKVLGKGNCFIVRDKEVLNSMKHNVRFIYQGGDLSTVQSELILFNGDDIVFKSGIVLGQNMEGLQSESFGWITPMSKGSLIRFAHEFKRRVSPVVFL